MKMVCYFSGLEGPVLSPTPKLVVESSPHFAYTCRKKEDLSVTSSYQGTPFKDEKYPGGPQSIPGKVMCAYYDLGGPDVAYYDTTPVNQGSGVLNPRNGTYLNEFRIGESVDTSYTKGDGIDDSPFNFVEPELGIPYIGWTEPGEWLNYTVEVKQSGVYSVRLLYTSNRGGAISLSVDGQDAIGAIPIRSTWISYIR
jgi:hypothetical protein